MTLSGLAAFNYAHWAEGFTAVKAVEFKDTLGMTFALTVLLVCPLQVLQQGLIFINGKTLMLMKLEVAVLLIFQTLLHLRRIT